MIGPDGVVRRGPTPVGGVGEPQVIHDMALTRRCLVLVPAPAFFGIEAAMNGGSSVAWRPERGTRIALIPRHVGPARWADDEAFWLWHTVNAHDAPDDGRVLLDYVPWPALSLGPGRGRAGTTD